MVEQSSIPVRKETHRLLRAHKENAGATYDEYLLQLIENASAGGDQ